MHVQPVVERELRVLSRNAGAYWLRVVAGIAAGSVLVTTLVLDPRAGSFHSEGRGPWILALLHTAFSLFLAAICPPLCSDTLSRERREGTLGLLLLTPLRPVSVVLGKVVAHLVRVFTLWLSIVPVLVVPLLLGGVSIVDVTFTLVIELGIVLGCLAGAFVASSLVRFPGSAMALGTLLTLCIGEGLALLSFVGLVPTLIAHPTCDYAKHWQMTAIFGPWFLGTGLIGNGFAGQLGRGPAWLATGLWTSLAAVFVGSWCFLGMSLAFATWRVRKFSDLRERSVAALRRTRFWFRPLWRAWACRAREVRLRRNPVLWLYTSRPSSALRRWGWCAALLAVWGMIYLDYEDNDWAGLVFSMPVLLMAALGLAAATGFRRQLEERSLELLLITPIPPTSILRAQIVALWRDFLPGTLIATAMAWLWSIWAEKEGTGAAIAIVSWSSFFALPAVGSRLAVRKLSPVVGWGWTLAIAALVPFFFASLAATLTQGKDEEDWNYWIRFLTGFVPAQLLLAGFCAWCTETDFATRRFLLKPMQRATR